MGKRSIVTVSSNDVRRWASEQDEYKGAKFLTPREGEAFARGRVPNAVVEAYKAAHPGHEVVTGHKAGSTREVTVTLQDARGRNYTRKVEVTLARIRELAGEDAPKRGTLGRSTIEAAEAALSAQMQAEKSAKPRRSRKAEAPAEA